MNAALSDTPLTPNQQQWLKHFQAAQAQNLSLAHYAKQHDIDPGKLYSWKSQLKQKGLLGGTQKTASSFVQVNAPATHSAYTPGLIRITLPNGIRLDITEPSDQLTAFIQALASR